MPHFDALHFDGSCAPNPGGALGWGWALYWRDGRVTRDRGHRPPAPDNTVNVAEYEGLLAGLRSYLAEGGCGPLEVGGESQVVVYQMAGCYQVNAETLRSLHAEAGRLVGGLPGRVTFTWTPPEQTQVLAALAAGRDHTAPAAVPARTLLSAPGDAPISPPLCAALTALNAAPAPGFAAFAALRVGGTDALSNLDLAALQARVPVPAVVAAATAFPTSARAQAAALRWALRGLALELAIQKVTVDRQIRAGQAAAQERRMWAR